MLESQLSRYGAISKVLPGLAPSAKVFLVGDSDDTNLSSFANEFSPDRDGAVRVFTTIQGAVNACAANRGDVVLVAPGHNEALARADSWNVAGVRIIGLGNGYHRARITYNDTAATVNLGADAVGVENLRFIASVSRITRALDLDTGFGGQSVKNCEFTWDATGDDFVTSIRIGSKRALVEGNQILMEDTSGPRQGIALLGGDADYAQIRNNLIVGQFDSLVDASPSMGSISHDTSDTTDTDLNGVFIDGNHILNTDTAGGMAIRFSAGYRTLALVSNNDIATYDCAGADSDIVAVGTQALFLNNRMKRPDTTEKLVGDSSIAG